MKKKLLVLSCVVAITALLSFAQSGDEGYQTGRVVAFEKVTANAQHMEDSGQYKISMRLGDTIYNCHAGGSASVFLDWTVGKEFPTRLNDKVLQVKNRDGQIVELKIKGKKTAK